MPPGRYVAVARSGGRGGDPKTGMQSIVVNGQNVGGVTLVLQPGVTLSGNITVESSGTPAPTDYSGFRVDVPDVDSAAVRRRRRRRRRRSARRRRRRAEKNGGFQIPNLLPGAHYIRVAGGGRAGPGGQGRGARPGAVDAEVGAAAGRTSPIRPFELKPGQNIDNVTVVLTDRATEICRDRARRARTRRWRRSP